MIEPHSYYLNKEEPVRGCLLALRNIILGQDTDITETQKWGLPCFCYKKRVFCYLWTDKKSDEPYILMIEGKFLDHPQLEKGSRSRMKILKINPNGDLPLDTIEDILRAAVDLYKSGVIKLKD